MTATLDHYERGQTVEALRRAEAFAPLREWSGLRPCIVAARIAANAGAPGLALLLSVRAWREERRSPAALSQFGLEILSRRGPVALWQRLREWQEAPGDSLEDVAELVALQSRAAASLRDFARAESLITHAESIDPRRAWIGLQRAFLLESQDRIEQALEVAEAASRLHKHPHYRPGAQTRAHLLQLLDRDDEAIGLLQENDAVLQSGPIAGQLYALLSENGRWAEAEAALDRYVALSPLLEPVLHKWVNSQRARAAYHLGRRVDAARFAARLEDDFHRQFAVRLAAAPQDPERLELDVTFVRQHFKTCAPATLASLGRFWKMPSEHLRLAEAICYDGTPIWQQRDWAEKNGWHVREFRATYTSAVELLERRIPFALSTVDATSAHMMAVIGFDRARATLLLRDPSQPYALETDADAFLQRYRAFGPHAIVFIPAGEASRLAGLSLPSAQLHDDHHRLWLALSRHDRAGAAAALERMEAEATSDPLTWEARAELATYDGNVAEQARCLDKLLELFPDNPARVLRRFACMRDAPRDERIAFMDAACAKKEADPALFVALARALQGDARLLPEARRRVKRAQRYRPTDSGVLQALAGLLWEQGELDHATELYRFAASLEGFREHLYQSWFAACRRTGRTLEAIEHLQDRFGRFGAQSEQPALTLAWAWKELDQPARARAVLDDAIRMRPGDGSLLLRAAALLAALGEHDAAEGCLDNARGKVRENDWLRTRLEIDENRFAFDAVIATARALLEKEPLALDAHAAVARALARREGTSAALAALQLTCAAFPRHYGLHRMLVEWSREAGPETVVASARALLALEPSDAWARRELAWALTQLMRDDEALREALDATHIEPNGSYSFSILAAVHRRLGQVAEARRHLQRAIELSVDNGDAISTLLDLARSDDERKADLALIERELVRQVVAGDGLLTYVDLAGPILQPESLLAVLRDAHAQRPDLWHAWSALVAQLSRMMRLDEALAVALQASARFAHAPRAWLDLAVVRRWRNEVDEEIGAAERAFEINPLWNPATLALTAALEKRGRMEDARAVYERALQHSPHDAQLRVAYANLLWRLRRNADAFACVERALRIAPAYEWAWTLLHDWAIQSGQPERDTAFARTLAAERPGDAQVWLMLARLLRAPGSRDERFRALERALDLDRRSTDTWDLKAECLALAERFDEAIRTCDDGAIACTNAVHILHGRRAWIDAQRGRRAEAIAAMRGVLASNAGYVWGWSQLASWLLAQESLTEATAAFAELRRLRPHESWVHHQLAYLYLKQKDRPRAKESFAAALEAAPTDVAAAHGLFDAQLEDSDLAGANATLRGMQTHQPGAATLAAEIILRLREQRSADALEQFEALCRSPDPDPWPLAAATDACVRADYARTALKRLKRCVRQGSPNPEVGAAIIRILLDRQAWLAAARMFMRFEPGEVQRRAAAPLLHGLAQNKCRIAIRWLLWRRRDALARDDQSWGQVGFALSQIKATKQAAAWLGDWRERPNVQPWMLFNYCLALRYLSRYAEATDVASYVVQTWGHRDGAADMRLFLAVEQALAGMTTHAREQLRLAGARKSVEYDQQMIALTEALIEFLEIPRSERGARFGTVSKRLAERFGNGRLLFAMRDARRTFRRAGELVVREGGGARAWLWFKWKLHWQWSLLAVAAVMPMIVAVAPIELSSLPLISVVLCILLAKSATRSR